MKKVGIINNTVQDKLKLEINGDSNIYIADTNIKHMKTSHPDDYSKYGNYLKEILSSPDYVGLNPKDSSIEYVKEFKMNNDYVKVAVRISAGKKYYARSLYILNRNRVNNFIKKGTLKSID